MNATNPPINITLSAVEMATIREALRYAAMQVHASDIPVFENYEPMNAAGVQVFYEDLHTDNQAKADLALELADTLDLIEASSYDWKVLREDCNSTMTDAQVCHKMCMTIVATYVTDKGTIYASADGTCWLNEVSDLCMNLATGECIEVLSSETDKEGNVDKLYYQI